MPLNFPCENEGVLGSQTWGVNWKAKCVPRVLSTDAHANTETHSKIQTNTHTKTNTHTLDLQSMPFRWDLGPL